MPKLPGVIKGLGVTLGTMARTITQGANTVQYPREKEAPPIRARGVIALREENCTVCMLCARSCPDWCIYIEGHKEKAPPRRPGGKPRTVSALDRFDIDYALCMYCGICVEVCPFDALFWSPEYEYSEPRIADLLHDKDKLGEWMETVPEAPELEVWRGQEGQEVVVAQNIAFGIIAALMILGAIRVVTSNNVVHAALWLVLVLAGAAAQYILLAAEFVAVTQVLVYVGAVMVLFIFGTMLTRAQIGRERDLNNESWPLALLVALVLGGTLVYVLIDAFGDDELPEDPAIQSVQNVSDSIFGPYLIPFWALSFVLLAAMVGAIVLARKD